MKATKLTKLNEQHYRAAYGGYYYGYRRARY